MVTGFMEKESQASGRVLINPDVYVLESDIVSPLESGVESDFGRDVFPRAIDRGLPVFAGRLASPMIDIGTPEGLSLGRSTARVSTAGYRTAHS
jgi:NDP-sugar pyrophosphorylase family protein